MLKYSTTHSKPDLKKGFTLVELAIVVAVIAALLVGLTFSRTLIETARITSVNTKMTKVLENVRIFKQQYGYLPGDLTHTACTTLDSALGCGTMTGTAATDVVNNLMYFSDTTKSACVSAPTGTGCDLHLATSQVLLGTGNVLSCSQTVYAVRQMQRVNMIDGVPYFDSNKSLATDSFTGLLAANTSVTTCHNTGLLYAKGPITGTRIMVATQPNVNQELIGVVNLGTARFTNIQVGTPIVAMVGDVTKAPVQASVDVVTPINAAIDPAMAKKLDDKFDDGQPTTGDIIGLRNGKFDGTDDAAQCRSTTAYNTTTANQKLWCNVGYVGE
jgi:prepilin-type N-terminal cleavage/methylation domain-containing protein